MSVNFTNIEYFIDPIRHIPIVELYFREGNKKIINEVDYFRPYFYSVKALGLSEIKIVGPTFTRYEKIEEIPTDRMTLKGEKVYKIQYTNPGATKDIRSMYESNGYEADIEFVRRFIIDNVKNFEKAKYRKIIIDIETTTDYGFSVAENPVEKVTLVSMYDSFSNKLATFVLLPDDMEKEDIDTKVDRHLSLIDKGIHWTNSIF